MERTFAMIKPDGVSRGLTGEIIKRYEQKGLKIAALKMMNADKATVEEHYIEHKEKSFYGELLDYILSGPVVAMVIEGHSAITLVRKLNGATKVEDAQPGTIRGDFAASTTNNIVHSSDSIESAEREIKLWFK
ncbi:nucleoside diphosphate kinase [Oxobacter pfennigii]|uniref:Nucleoside diphosphate kinase n=1 Tax=Oxobacter pfennigii TaxID=36849 RepID=A0A0P8WVL9_9CLOT|nr:nucleoside-diphosphate kinase [Oxobacter pfennigii]KPU42290.1 nucleoside diphosphate kinase [Oxobacter pfennigii]